MREAMRIGWVVGAMARVPLWIAGAGLAACAGDAGDAGARDDGSAGVEVGAETGSGTEVEFDGATESESDGEVEFETEVGSEVEVEVASEIAFQTTTEALLEADDLALTAGRSAPVSFDVPADAIAVSVTVVGLAPTFYALDRWSSPDGAELVTPGWFTTDPGGYLQVCALCANRIWANPGAFSALAPNNPGVTLAAGTHTVVVLATPPIDETVQLWVHAKRSIPIPPRPPNGPAAGPPDRNRYVTGAQGLTAATAPSDLAFQGALDAVAAIYAEADLTLGTLSYQDIADDFRDITSLSGAGSDIAALFASGTGDPHAVNLYFVDSIVEGGHFFGYSGGIPGPTELDGTARSGVAIALAPVAGIPMSVDKTIAHELAHFLGLFHASEARFAGHPEIVDQLPDTPSGVSDNLMSFAGTGAHLTPMQGVVMRTSFWVRHPRAD